MIRNKSVKSQKISQEDHWKWPKKVQKHSPKVYIGIYKLKLFSLVKYGTKINPSWKEDAKQGIGTQYCLWRVSEIPDALL